MFILNVIKIFFENKYREIKRLPQNRLWCEFMEGLIIILVAVAVITIFLGTCFGVGFLVVEVMEYQSNISYTGIGMIILVSIGMCLASLYALYRFVKWIWTNIKIAIAEAKEL